MSGGSWTSIIEACSDPGQQGVTALAAQLQASIDERVASLIQKTTANFEFKEAENIMLRQKIAELESRNHQAMNALAEQNARILEQEMRLRGALFHTPPNPPRSPLGKRPMDFDCEHATPRRTKEKERRMHTASDVKRTKEKERVVHTACDELIIHAFVITKPMLDIEGWTFKNIQAVEEFWNTLVGLKVYHEVNKDHRLKSAKKALNALGYSHQDSPHFSTSLRWTWDIQRSMINCYWLKTTVMLHTDVKNKIKVLAELWKEMPRVRGVKQGCFDPLGECFSLTDDNIEARVKDLFVFADAGDAGMKLETRKMEEVVAISQCLKRFWKEGKIGTMVPFCTRIDSEVQEEKLRNALRSNFSPPLNLFPPPPSAFATLDVLAGHTGAL